MENIVVQEDETISVLDAADLNERLSKIRQYTNMGRLLTETAMYHIYLIQKFESWREQYNSFEECITAICENIPVSRAHVFVRLRAYRTMELLGILGENAIKKLCEHPGHYTTVLEKVVKIGKDSAIVTILPDTKNTQEFLEEMESLKPNEVIKHIEETYTLKPKIEVFWTDSDILQVNYASYLVNTDGNSEIDEEGIVKFYPDRDVPDWVLDKIKKIRL